jgi:hypothetical protein
MKYYTIYKITNLINKKYYIGKHITNNINDSYMGSGKLIKKAIEKYGIENFKKEIIKVYDNEHDMNIAESLLIDLTDKLSYNLQEGGKGSWNYVNENNLSNTKKSKQKKSEKLKEYWTEEKKQKKSLEMKKYNDENGTQRYTEVLLERYKDPVFKEKFIETMNVVNKDEEKRKKAGEKISQKWKNDKEFQEKMKKRKTRGSDGSALKEKWKDPVWRQKMLDARKKGKQNETN